MRPGQLDEVQFDAKAGRLLLPRITPAWVLLIGQKHLVADLEVEPVADDVVPLGAVARQGQLVALAVQERGQCIAGAAGERVFVVAEPRVLRLAEGLSIEEVVDHGAEHRQRCTADVAAVQVDPISGQQPLAAQLGPVAFRVSVQLFPRWQGVRSPGECFFGLCLGDAQERRSHGSTLDELATVEHG